MKDYELILSDCLEAMQTLGPGSVDAIICDPPYGTTACKWDAVIPFEPMWAEVWRVLKPNGVALFTAAQPFTSALVMSQPKAFRYEWVWSKNKASGHLNAKKRPMRAHEDILVFCRGKVPYSPQKTKGHAPANNANTNANSENYGAQVRVSYGGETTRYPRTIQDFQVVNNIAAERVHPTQKPVPLMEYLVRTYTAFGQTVLDFTMGSGTTGVACLNTGRRFIGIEKDPNYFAMARTRIEAAAMENSEWESIL